MVPVSLRLHNFISYGTGSEPLDFEQFRVACLSGANGHGKSALLEAMTWALWGEARKSSGSVKPDEELLRIGAREMQVEFVFDLEGERYRVIRSYHRSASGKTSRPNLEVQVQDADLGQYRPLTAGSIAETQELLTGVVGIDYDTFINSAFLLQGRSDEFTKKKPTERKEILARILGLERYDRLAEAAREKERAAEDAAALAEAEIERLGRALAFEESWRADRQEAERAILEQQAALEAVARELAGVVERLVGLDALERELRATREAVEKCCAWERTLGEEAEGLRTRLRAAEALVARAGQIRETYGRYESLCAERNRLDEKRELYWGLEKQLEQKRAELERQRGEVERKLHGLEERLKAHRASLAADRLRLEKEPRLRGELEEARRALREFEALRLAAEEHRRLTQRHLEVERRLSSERASREGRLQALRQQIERDRARLPSLERLEQREREAAEQVRRLERAVEQQHEIRDQGTKIRTGIDERQQQLELWRADAEALREKTRNIHSLEADVCPTCGTSLTEQHRRRVEQSYLREVRQIEERAAATRAWMDEQAQQRLRLLESYKRLETEVAGLQPAAREIVQLREQIAGYRRDAARIEGQLREAEVLEATLADGSWGGELLVERDRLAGQLAEHPFDEQHFEQVRLLASQCARREEEARELELVRGQVEELEQRIRQGESEIRSLREGLDGGVPFRAVQEQIAALQGRMASMEYDAPRHARLRQEIETLKEAPDRLKELLDAQQNAGEWNRRLADVEALRAERLAEAAALREQAARLEAALAERPALAERQQALVRGREEAQERLNLLQQRLGQLVERLEQCLRDREALHEQQAHRVEAQRKRTLFHHLRRAFSKHGIPSLIIEQTLPEIEERANALLDRLTDGRTRVRLETLKNKKTGGTKETLEIQITDEQGVARAYETFSGGEAFRVNFALRIALSQLLAERSGVRIRTLVVDEGFGTQDRQGMQSLIESINAIQDDFDKILVITHIEDLKEAFPVRIEVYKDPVEGSSYQVVGV